ncbi:hypothetical protein CY35_03G003400 [Sphagnum magellanicum]|nr:hypothetical protein CY35_03G003400 [Sphagnum magellanicum]KAH9566951.1 hypothetical protein CY35_03G003400 [Sphagnum magellanicum]KAH9566955.1 hypothetical protein CY35_03G003400 [Sphagnum magellanicum]
MAMPQATRRNAIILCVGFLVLHLFSMQARQYVGDQSASKTGKFSMWDCFDLNVGSIVCVTKEAAKLYTNSFQAGLVEQAKQKAYHSALQSALAQGMVRKEAERQSQKLARAAGKEKSHQAQRILGPLFAAVWDTFEVLYYGGSFVEASMRASGTLSGTWFGALEGEKRMGRVGYLVGGHIGSWVGSRLALMVYDIGKAGQLMASQMSGLLFGIDNNGGDEL